MKELRTITYLTSEKHCFKLTEGEEETLLADNRGKYHSFSIF